MRFSVICLVVLAVFSVVDKNILCGRCFYNDLDERVQSRNAETLDFPSRDRSALRLEKLTSSIIRLSSSGNVASEN